MPVKCVKVFLTRPLHDFAVRHLQKRHVTTTHAGVIPIPKEALLQNIRDTDGLVCFPGDVIDREIIDAAACLKSISTYSVGHDHIDTEYAKKKKIRIGYTPDVLTDATADLAMALILDVSRRVTEGDRIIRAGRWNSMFGACDYLGRDLRSKTLGILGMGRIGTAVAKRAIPFGMNITYHNRRPLADNAIATWVNIEQLVSESDIISIHMPHTENTDRMFDEKMFESMKDTAILINTSRGKIINQNDLVAALANGVIAGAGLDVFESEPINSENPLASLQNVVLAPHIGSSTIETRIEMARLTIKNLELGMAGKSPIHSVGY